MPLKSVFSRTPLLIVPHAFLSNGLIRTDDKKIIQLYRSACLYEEKPFLWEGLFSIACLIKNEPLKEPVAAYINEAVYESEEGPFRGSITEQIQIARAAFSLYEYTVDKRILKRLALWFRYLETDFDRMFTEDGLLFHSADLMELLVRYYQVTGLKSVLRLCSLVRASSFDWTTVLHTFKHSVHNWNKSTASFSISKYTLPEKMNYDEKEKLINHAETLADGMRYTLYSGIFSGSSLELSAGYAVWQYLLKHHRAICGGTTADPFLCGKSADKAVNNNSLMAWIEAFSSQMLLNHYSWAADELTRILYNALDDCLKTEKYKLEQYVNITDKQPEETDSANTVYFLSRLTRAASCIIKHAVTITQEGIKINYLFPCRMILALQKQSVILDMTLHDIIFHSSDPFTAAADLFVSATETAEISMIIDHKQIDVSDERLNNRHSGFFIHSDRCWLSGEGYSLKQGNKTIIEPTNHQGICIFLRNQLMSLPLTGQFDPVAVSGSVVYKENKTILTVSRISAGKGDKMKSGDIPVLPDVSGESFEVQLESYSSVCSRITMFPRGKRHD